MKAIHLIAAFGLAVGSITAPSTPANADPANPPGQNGANAELLQFCTDLLQSGEFSEALTFGRCMAFNTTSDQGFATQFCGYLRGEGLLGDYGFVSYSDCVVNIR